MNTPAALRATPSRGRHWPSGKAGPAVALGWDTALRLGHKAPT
jgi:hypothetical protein